MRNFHLHFLNFFAFLSIKNFCRKMKIFFMLSNFPSCTLEKIRLKLQIKEEGKWESHINHFLFRIWTFHIPHKHEKEIFSQKFPNLVLRSPRKLFSFLFSKQFHGIFLILTFAFEVGKLQKKIYKWKFLNLENKIGF